MVIWGHEHECLIDPVYNPEMNFHVMQPGSSVATSLMPGEAVPKHVAVLSITGRDFEVETIRLKTVRPFVMREIVLSEEKEAMKLAKKANNRTQLTEFLTRIVDDMIKQAEDEWEAAQGDSDEEKEPPLLPLIRLRVEYTAPEGGNFDCENPQRFSNRFNGKVANIKDVVQFYRKKKVGTKRAQNGVEMPEDSMLESMTLDSVKVAELVREFLEAQSLTIFPSNSFGDAVNQFIEKEDKHAMEDFVTDNLKKQVEQLMLMDKSEENIQDAMEQGKSHLEELFASGVRTRRKIKRKPRPDGWDSELNGPWDEQPAAIDRSDLDDEEEDESDEPVVKPPAKGRGKAAPKKAAAPAKKPAPAKNPRGKKKVVESEDEENEDVVMLDSDDDESQLFVKPEPPTRGSKKVAPAKAPPPKRAPARAAATKAGKQSQLNFSQPKSQPRGTTKKAQEVSDDDISDDDDAFEPAPSARSSRGRR